MSSAIAFSYASMTPLERRNGFYNINKALYDANYAKFLKTCYLYAKIKIEKIQN